MGFRLGSFLSGAAKEIGRISDQEEKELDDLINSSLLYHEREFAADKKARDEEIKETEELINSLTVYFPNDPNALEKAAYIASQGAAHANNLKPFLETAAGKREMDAFMKYYRPDKEGKKSALEYARSMARELKSPDARMGDLITRSRKRKGIISSLVAPDAKSRYQEKLDQRKALGLFDEGEKSERYQFGRADFDFGVVRSRDFEKEITDTIAQLTDLPDTPENASKRKQLEDRLNKLKTARQTQEDIVDPVEMSPARFTKLWSERKEEIEKSFITDNRGAIIGYQGKTGPDAVGIYKTKIDEAADQFATNIVDSSGNIKRAFTQELPNYDQVIQDAVKRRQEEIKGGTKDKEQPDPKTAQMLSQYPTAESFLNSEAAKNADKGKVISALVQLYKLSKEEAEQLYSKSRTPAPDDIKPETPKPQDGLMVGSSSSRRIAKGQAK